MAWTSAQQLSSNWHDTFSEHARAPIRLTPSLRSLLPLLLIACHSFPIAWLVYDTGWEPNLWRNPNKTNYGGVFNKVEPSVEKHYALMKRCSSTSGYIGLLELFCKPFVSSVCHAGRIWGRSDEWFWNFLSEEVMAPGYSDKWTKKGLEKRKDKDHLPVIGQEDNQWWPTEGDFLSHAIESLW